MPSTLLERTPPAVGTLRERASARRALRLLNPSASQRWDPPALLEIFRFNDCALALLSLLVPFLLFAPGEVAGALARLPGARVGLWEVLLLGGFLAWWHGAYVLLGMYGVRRISRRGDETVAVGVASALGAAVLLPWSLLPSSPHGPAGVGIVWLSASALVLLSRALLRGLWRAVVRRPARRILIVGSGPRAQALLRQLREGPGKGGRVVGHIDRPEEGELEVPYLGGLDELETVLMRTAVDAVLIALPIKSCYAEVQHVIEICERIGVVAEYPADVFRCAGAEPRLDPDGGRSVVAIGVTHDEMRRRVKRALDLLGASVGLLISAPLLLLIALAIRLGSPGPVLFVQQRCGRNRQVFRMYKFRTMVSNAEQMQAELEHLNEAPGPVFKIRRDPRITPLGRFLRRTSLDELPQLFNVLRGEMSLVGPRPLPLRDVHRFSAPSSMRRFSVRPGMTCLWQVNGRSDVPFDDWMTLDLQYIDRWSLLLDLRIIARTVPAVLRGVGAT